VDKKSYRLKNNQRSGVENFRSLSLCLRNTNDKYFDCPCANFQLAFACPNLDSSSKSACIIAHDFYPGAITPINNKLSSHRHARNLFHSAEQQRGRFSLLHNALKTTRMNGISVVCVSAFPATLPHHGDLCEYTDSF